MNEQRPGGGSRLSGQTRERLERELAELRARHRALDEVVASTDGVEDRADQAQRLELADDLARLAERIREIVDVLAGRIAPSPVDALPEGTEVTVRFSDGTAATMRVVAIPEEASDAADTLTRTSPLGRALVGARPGERIAYPGPDGEIVAEVVAIRPPTDEGADATALER
ncbi:GreA/GreB family elongation factor [Pseudonocardia hispaniensis]|uniref:GreA/GreB family elongation factor n=1 Tax=Pseudonocardia hispaniensis TaxID=904933 RepID=A0ABW1IYP8_9PSEU